MREILFRGKDKYSERWYEGFILNKNKDKIGYYNNCLSFNILEVKPETIGQFTGLFDKNGKKVFEGDIVGYEWRSGIKYDYAKYYGKYRVEGIVRYGNFNCSCCDGVFGWYIEDGDIRGFGDHTNIEVIGNIHDNPELLGE